MFGQTHVWGGIGHSAFTVAQPCPMKDAYDACINAEIGDCFRHDFRRPWTAE